MTTATVPDWLFAHLSFPLSCFLLLLLGFLCVHLQFLTVLEFTYKERLFPCVCAVICVPAASLFSCVCWVGTLASSGSEPVNEAVDACFTLLPKGHS